MIIQRKRGFHVLLLLMQGTLITLVFGLCALATFNFFTSIIWSQVTHYPIYVFALTAGLFLESLHRDQSGLELSHFEDSFIKQHQLSLRQTLYSVGVLLVYLVVTKDGTISRIFLGLCLPMFYLTFLLSNRYLARRLAKYLFRGKRKGLILLIGPMAKAVLLKRWLQSKSIFGVETVGILNNSPAQAEIPEIFPRLGNMAAAETVIREMGVTQVILLELPEEDGFYQNLRSTLESQGVRLLILNNLEEKLHHPVCYLEDEGHNFVGLREEPLENPFNRVSKRALDVAFSLPVVLFVLPPVALVVWLIQRINSPGPLLYRQVRSGLQNDQFIILKFRTMHVLNREETRQASRDDDRIYRGGRFLRKYSIDELPQFINALRGEMSLVGPRPHLTEHNAEFAKVISRFPIRMVVKPGITGLAQVRGFRGEARNAEAIDHRLQSDIEYLENWRLTLDFVIIARTAVQMLLPPPTAY